MKDIFSKHVAEIKHFIIGIFLSLSIDLEIAKILVFLMLLDTFFGVIKSIVLKSLQFNFKALFFGLSIKLLIILIPMSVALVGKGLGFKDFKTIIDIIFKLLIISEGLSIWSSFISIRKNKEVKQIDFISIMVENIHRYFKNKFYKFLKVFSDEN